MGTYKVSSAVIGVACAVLIVGCSSHQPLTGSTNSASAPSTSGAEVARQAELVKAKDSEIARLQSELDRQQQLTMQSADGGMATSTSGDGSLFPPDPKPGECYARVIVPATYETLTDTILAREAGERIEIVPASYETVEETVVTKEASTRLEVVQAVFETVSEQVLVRPASTRVEEVPAVYETVTEQVLDTPARTEWKRGTGVGSGAGFGGAAAQITRFAGQKVLNTKVVEDTGEVMCLVEVPATYKTISKQVLVSPATTRSIEVPGEYKTVTKTVEVQPASTREIEVPAEYGTVEVTKIVNPSSERRIPIPEEYTTVTQQRKVTDEEIVWRPVLCEVNMTAGNVAALQSSISSQTPGCWKCGRADGIIGPCTIEATQCYARQNGLSSGEKYVTIELIRHLGLEF